MYEKQLHILLVEDNPTDALLLEESLGEAGTTEFALTCVTRLDGALASLREHVFDIVLLDLGLPDSDGLKTFAQMQCEHSAVPILILSGLEDEALAIQAVHDGAQDFLVKGKVNSTMLSRTIRYAIERKRSEQKLMSSEMGYRRLFEAAQDGILILDAATGQITDANPYLEKLLGYTLAEFIGKRLWEIAPFRDKEASQAAFHTLQEKGYIRYDDLPLLTRDGQQVQVEFVSNVYAVGSRQVIQCNIRDVTERKQAEQQLRIHSRLLNVIGQALIVTDQAGKITYWNDFAKKLFGWSSAEVVGRNILDITPTETTKEQAAEILACLSQGKSWSGELILQKRDGTTFPAFVTDTPVLDEAGNIVSIIGISFDISERRQAEAELQASHNLLQAVIEGTTDAIFVRNLEGNYLLINSAGAGLLNRTVDEVIGKNQKELFPPETVRAFHEIDRKILATGNTDTSEEIGIIGDERTFLTNKSVLRDGNGNAAGIIGVARDITESKRAQAGVARLAAIVESSNDAILSKTLDGIITSWNTGAEILYGYSAEETMGCPVSMLIPPDRPYEEARLLATIARGERVTNYETVRVRKDGSYFDISLTLSPVKNTAGEIIGASAISRDITDRKQAEDALRASEAEFRTLAEAMPQMVWITRPDGWNIYFSQQWMDYTGLTLEESLGHGWNKPFHPDDQQHAWDAWQHATATRGTYSVESRLRRADGVYRWYLVRGVPLQDAEGNILKWFGTCTDIHDLKMAQATQARLVGILEATPDFVGIADASQHPIYINRAGRSMLGIAEGEDVSNISISDLVAHWARSAVNAGIVAAIHDGVWTGETTLLSRTGQEISVSQVILSHKTDKGEMEFISTVARDITSLKEAAAALQKANVELELNVTARTAELSLANDELQLQKTILESQGEASNDGILVVANNKVVSFNRRFAEMWDMAPEDMAMRSDGAALQSVVDKINDPETFLDRVAYLYKHGDEQSQEEILLKDGSTFDRYSAPVRGADGTNHGRIWFFHDITERKQAEVTLQEAKEEAERANLAKSEFLSRMSHELRTPLNAILGFGQVLAMRDLQPREKECVAHIVRGGQHLLELINEVLDIARVEAGHLSLSLEPVAVFDVVREAIDMVNPLGTPHGIRLLTDGEHPCTTYVHADRQRLKQVLINLLSNAVKYNRPHGKVIISCTPADGERLRIAVIDDGHGISGENVARLFVPFERLGVEKSNVEGTGLGLTLSRHLVEAMGGVLEVSSVVGQGSTFSVVLPMTEAPIAQLTTAANGQPSENGLGEIVPPLITKSVLAIEDNAANLNLLEAIFESRPHAALMGAVQGSIGLELARRHRPDLILLDLHLPDMPGLEVLQSLGRFPETKDIPVIVISADATQSQIARLLKAGAKDYLTKPINVEALLQIIDEIQ